MQSLKKNKSKVILLTVASVLLAVALVLSGVGIYLKLTYKPKETAKINPLDFSIDAWDGTTEALNFNENFANRGQFTKTINSAESFVHFINEVNNGNTFEDYTIYLNSSLDFKGQKIPSIGNFNTAFKGVFDGGHYTIYNANVTGEGLFENTEDAVIKNIGLYNCNASLINKAYNTNIENTFVRLGSGKLANEYISNNAKHFIKNSFVDTNAEGLIGLLNTDNTSVREVTISNCYYTNGENAILNETGVVYKVVENVIKATNKSDFVNWSYSDEYSADKDWCDYDYLENTNSLDFNFPLQSGFVKVYLTGSCYEGVLVAGNTIVDAINLPAAFEEASKSSEAEINLLVEKIFMEARAEVANDTTIKVNAAKDTTIVRGDNNADSMFVGGINSKIVLGSKPTTTIVSQDESNIQGVSTMRTSNNVLQTTYPATIVLDGNKDVVEETGVESGALVVSYGGEIEINENVILKNNINNNVKYGGAVLAYNTTTKPVINGMVENCHAELGGGAVAVVGTIPEDLPSARNCSTSGKGGAIYIAETIEEPASIASIKKLYGKNHSVQPVSQGSYTSPIVLTGKTYSNCGGATHGGGIYTTADIMLNNCSFTGDLYLAECGGGLYVDGNAYLNDCSFNSCLSNAGGGAYVTGNVSINASASTYTFTSNLASTSGGAVYAGGNVEISGVPQFKSNSIDRGVPDSTYGYGGAIYANGTLNISGAAVFDSNITSGVRGGAVYAGGKVTISAAATFINNQVTYGQGGAIYCNAIEISGNAVFTSNKIISDMDYWEGCGAAIVCGDVNIYGHTTFDSNRASGDLNTRGGAISGGRNVTISNSTFTSNYAEGYIVSGTNVTITNCTFTSNIAGNSYPVGVVEATYLTINGDNTVFENHERSYAGGVAYVSNTITINDNPTFRNNISTSEMDTTLYAKDIVINGNPTFANNQGISGGVIQATNVYINGNPIFRNNRARNEDTNSYETEAHGGVIYATNVEIAGNPVFDSNIAYAHFSYGGAIYAESVTISGNPVFQNNGVDKAYTSDPTRYAYGGAICATTVTVTSGANPKFIGNYTTCSEGGAINATNVNLGGGEFYYNSVLPYNWVGYGEAGAIYASDTINITGKTSFVGNDGFNSSAIRARTINISAPSIFKDNLAYASPSAAIYSYTSLTISSDIVLENNIAVNMYGGEEYNSFEIYVGGTFTLSGNLDVQSTNTTAAIYLCADKFINVTNYIAREHTVYLATPAAGENVVYSTNANYLSPMKNYPFVCKNSGYVVSQTATNNYYKLISGTESYTPYTLTWSPDPVLKLSTLESSVLTWESSVAGTMSFSGYFTGSSAVASYQMATTSSLKGTVRITGVGSGEAVLAFTFDPTNSAYNYTYHSIRVVVEQQQVSFDVNGGTCSTSSANIQYGSSYGSNIDPWPTPTRAGFTFAGWYGKNLFDMSSAPSVQDQHVSSGASFSGDVSLVEHDKLKCLYMSTTAMYDTANGYYYFPINAKENTQYTISYQAKLAETISGTSSATAVTGLGFYYSDGTYGNVAGVCNTASWQVVSATSAIGKTVVGLYIPNEYIPYAYYTDIQVEEGTSVTSYDNYCGISTEISANTSVSVYSSHTLRARWNASAISVTKTNESSVLYYGGDGALVTLQGTNGSGSYIYTTNSTHFRMSTTEATSDPVVLYLDTTAQPAHYHPEVTITDAISGASTTYSGCMDLFYPFVSLRSNATTQVDSIYPKYGTTDLYGDSYGETPKTIYTPSARDGYEFLGWETESGSLVVNADGSLVKNVTGWTDIFGLWALTNTSVLYEAWEAKVANLVIGTKSANEILHNAVVERVSGTTETFEVSAGKITFTADLGDKITIAYSTLNNFNVYQWLRTVGTVKTTYGHSNYDSDGDSTNKIFTLTFTITEEDIASGTIYYDTVSSYGITRVAMTNFTQDDYGNHVQIHSGEWSIENHNGNPGHATLTLNARSASSYKFIGWYLRVAPTLANYKLEDYLYRSAEECTQTTDGDYIVYTSTFNPSDVNPYDGEYGGGTIYALFLKESFVEADAHGGSFEGDESLIELGLHLFGDTVKFANPIKTGYTLSGWRLDGGGSVVNNGDGTSTYTYGDENLEGSDSDYCLYAEWTPNMQKITWMNADGSVLEVDTNVPYDSMPSYDGETPTMAESEYYVYTFAGWSPTISKVTGDTTYTAVYDVFHKVVSVSKLQTSVFLGESLDVVLSVLKGKAYFTITSSDTSVIENKIGTQDLDGFSAQFALSGGTSVDITEYLNIKKGGTVTLTISIYDTINLKTYTIIITVTINTVQAEVVVSDTALTLKYGETAQFTYSANADGKFEIFLSDSTLATIDYHQNAIADFVYTATITPLKVGTSVITVRFDATAPYFIDPEDHIINITIEKNKLATPTNIKILENENGGLSVLNWDVIKVNGINVTYLYTIKKGESSTSYSNETNLVDMSTQLRNLGSGLYTFAVQAISDNTDYCENSATSSFVGYAGVLNIEVQSQNSVATLNDQTTLNMIVGETFDLTAAVSAAYQFVRWEVTGECSDVVHVADKTAFETTVMLDSRDALSGTVVIKAIAQTAACTVTVMSNNKTYGTVSIESFSQPYGSQITENGNKLTIGAQVVTATPAINSVQYFYEFVGWSGISGFTNLVRDLVVVANFEEKINQYTITVETNNETYGKVNQAKSVEVLAPYGTMVLFIENTVVIGETQVVAHANSRTIQNTFSFVAWDGKIEYVQAATTIKAIFTSTINQYTVTFKSNNTSYGTVNADPITVDYGTPITPDGNSLIINGVTVTPNPTASTDFITYSFVEWVGLADTVTRHMTIVANFSMEVKTFKITIVSSNTEYGQVSIGEITAAYGSQIHAIDNVLTIGDGYSAAITKENTSQYVYDFTGWTCESESVNGKTVEGQMTITANFTRTTQQYTVTIVVQGDNGTLNDTTSGEVKTISVTVDYGTDIIVDNNKIKIGNTTITATPAAGMEFECWIGLVGTVEQTITIQAKFI